MIACPTPSKTRYATIEAAETSAERIRAQEGPSLRAYECGCAWWHLSRSQFADLPDEAPDPDEVQRIQRLPTIQLRQLVARDVSSKAPVPARLALRHPSNLARWMKILTQLVDDADQQLQDRREKPTPAYLDWRRRAIGYRNALEIRVTECRWRLGQAPEQAAAELTGPERRAIDRLITAHADEFRRYLAEEAV
ncbi:hypothetical protein [Streptomyces sp. NPDC096153]|uniref:hypothetical protein n=1 Tax=Streptomyces sp. NPDC096153 TaxID=3155548 RepID=UPI003325DE04